MIDFEEYLALQMKDPEFAAEWEALDERRELMSLSPLMIVLTILSGLAVIGVGVLIVLI